MPSRRARHAAEDANDHLKDTDYDEQTKYGLLHRQIKWEEGVSQVQFPRARYEILKKAEAVAMNVKGKLHKGYLRGRDGFDQTTALWADHLLEQAFNEDHFHAFRANFPREMKYPPPPSALWPFMDDFIEHVLFPHGLYRGDRQSTRAEPANSRDIVLVPSQVQLGKDLSELGPPHIFKLTFYHHEAGVHTDSGSDNEASHHGQQRPSHSPSGRVMANKRGRRSSDALPL